MIWDCDISLTPWHISLYSIASPNKSKPNGCNCIVLGCLGFPLARCWYENFRSVGRMWYRHSHSSIQITVLVTIVTLLTIVTIVTIVLSPSLTLVFTKSPSDPPQLSDRGPPVLAQVRQIVTVRPHRSRQSWDGAGRALTDRGILFLLLENIQNGNGSDGGIQ